MNSIHALYCIFLLTLSVSFSLEDQTENSNNCSLLTNQGHVYDLSLLAKEDYWQYSEASHHLDEKKDVQYKTFYLSICHPIIGKSNCSNTSQVCFKDPTGTIDKYINAGTASKPSVMHEGLIEINYENGQICEAISGGKTHYSTKLYLQCPSNDEDYAESAGPILLTSRNPCSYMFIWTTLSACPKKITPTKECIFKLSNSEYPINLHALSHPAYYNVSGFNSSFELNICEPINNGSCKGNDILICDTTSNTPKVVATTADLSKPLPNLGYGLLFNSTNTEVRLFCDRKEFSKIIRYFPKKENQTLKHIFTIHSVFLCSPKQIDCVFEDENMHTYDLRSLHKKKSNWEVIVRENDKQKLFHINICGPVNENKFTQCPEGPVGVCQTSVNARGARNHGFITSHPIVNSDASITLLFTGGDSCRSGVPFSSSRINLICSPSDYNPIFVGVTESCEYIFLWHTRSACPLNVVKGQDCFVMDPVYGNVYDLNPLRNTASDYQITGEFNFLINICGPLVSKCLENESTSTGICQLRNESNLSGGSYPAQLIFNDGTIFMKFTNGSVGCGNSTWESQILLLCSHTDPGDTGPQYLHADFNSCTHYFIWYTKFACPPHTDISCIVSHGDDVYDLTPLSSPKFNQIFIIKNNTKKFILNVCRSVVHSKESRCSYDAGACLIDKSHKGSSLSLGKVTSPPKYKDGSLTLRYTNGDPCLGNKTYETLIEFRCSREEYLSYPNFVGEENCLYLFEWATIHACPQSSNVNPFGANNTEENKGNCTVINPDTGYLFDMNSLSNNSPSEIIIDDDSLLLINICGEVQDARCKTSGLGACVIRRKPWQKYYSSAGSSTKDLQFNMWNTFLEYTGGEECQNGLKRSTKISFICKSEKSPSGPFMIDDDKDACIFFINWYTEKACERHISCLAKSWERTIDLTPLIKGQGNYEVRDPTDNSTKYLLNVCKPLNPIIGTNCHPGSSACMINGSSQASSDSPLSLGHPITMPRIIGDQVALMYSYGSPCPEHKAVKISSKVFFKCDKTAGVGAPTFLRKTHDCQIQFEWKTSFVCEEDHSKDYGDQCQIYFEAAKANLELRPLYRPNGYKVVFNNKTFLINVCGSVCSHSGVCTEDGQNYGQSQKSELRWQQGSLLLQYYSGDPCKQSLSGFKGSKIYFECDMSAGYGQPVADPIMENSHCMAIFYWRTNTTCLEAIYNPKVIPKPSPNTPSPKIITTTSAAQGSNSTASSEMPSALPKSSKTGQIAIGIIVFVALLVLVIFYLSRDGYIKKAYQRVRFFSKKGDQLLILDDHM